MADRLKSLRRINAVQKQMVRLAEARLVTAERACRTLVEDKARLESYLSEQDAPGVPLAKAALKSLHLLDGRRCAADRVRKASEAVLLETKRREKAIEGIEHRAAAVVRREDEDRALADVVEPWLLRKDASLR